MNWFKNNAYYLVFFLIGIILISIYKIYLPAEGQPHISLYLFKEIGMAMVIAIMLVYSIELVTRKRHDLAAEKWQNEANKNVFRSIYKRYIPEAVFAEVESCLLNSKVYRDDYTINYTLRDMEEHELKMASNDHFIAEVKSRYTLINTTDSDIKHLVTVNLDVPNEDDFVKFTTITSVKADNVELLKACPIVTDVDGKCLFQSEIIVSAGGQKEIIMQGQTAKRKIDSEVWSSRLPSTGLDIFITSPAGVEVKCNANNSSKIIMNEARNFSNVEVWELKNGIFPYQSVIMWWNGKVTQD